jgi:hypothetical protein
MLRRCIRALAAAALAASAMLATSATTHPTTHSDAPARAVGTCGPFDFACWSGHPM